MKKLAGLIAVGVLAVSSFGADGRAIAKSKGVSASSKATAQWQRKFDKGDAPFAGLSAGDAKALLDYLKAHAADTSQPEAAGM